MKKQTIWVACLRRIIHGRLWTRSSYS